MLRFSQLASEIVHAEQTFHADFFCDWGLSDEDVWMTYRLRPTSPTRATCWPWRTLAPCESVGAVAFRARWIYLKVGKKLAETGSASPLYQRWIDLYAGDEYEAMIQDVLAIANRLERPLTIEEREGAFPALRHRRPFEWMFGTWGTAGRSGQYESQGADVRSLPP